jgi:hypothetical protein
MQQNVHVIRQDDKALQYQRPLGHFLRAARSLRKTKRKKERHHKTTGTLLDAKSERKRKNKTDLKIGTTQKVTIMCEQKREGTHAHANIPSFFFKKNNG